MREQSITSRKEEHVNLTVRENVTYEKNTTGFEWYGFEHNALPELDFEEIDTSASFLNRALGFPFMISGMTGGYADAGRINAMLAEVCEEERIAIGSGSQRQAIDRSEMRDTFTVLRKHAPSVPVLANIGAAEVAKMKDASVAQMLVDMLEADALAVHLNPLQEFIQPEGNPQFRGVTAALEMLVRVLPVPVVVKEVGAGISGAVAQRLFNAGIRYIDVAGAGGTTWAGVEMLRRTDVEKISVSFREWGIPTADALVQVVDVCPDDAAILCSGGIKDGMDIAKALALGAALTGAARPMLMALLNEGQEGLRATIRGWRNDLAGAMFLTGVRTIKELRDVPVFRMSKPMY